jgi:VanZ family protein
MPYHLATPASGLYSTLMIVAGQAAAQNFSNAVQFSLMRAILMKIPRWLPAVVMMTAIFAFSSIPASGMPSFGLFDLLVKKGGHALGYALLALTILHWRRPLWDESPPPIKDLFLAWALTALYAASDEFHQSFVPGRMASPLDVLIDAIGAFLGLSLYTVYRIFPNRS